MRFLLDAGFDPRYLPEEEEAETEVENNSKSESDSGTLDIEAIGGALHAQKLEADAQKNQPPREVRIQSFCQQHQRDVVVRYCVGAPRH